MSENKTTPPTILQSLAVASGNEPFANPYADSGELSTKLTCQIAPDDYNYIRCIRPSHGTNTGVIGTLWKKLINELNKRNIHSIADIKEFERFVANCRIVSYEEGRIVDEFNYKFSQLSGNTKSSSIGGTGLSNSPVNGDLYNSTSSSVGDRTKESGSTATSVETVGANLQERNRTKRRRNSENKKSEGTDKENDKQ